MTALKKGDRVRHATHGEGEVTNPRHANIVRVRFDGGAGMAIPVPRTELVSLAPEGGSVAAEDWDELPEEAVAWRMLEALRLGIVPTEGARHYTVGRDRELSSIRTMLRESRGCRVVWGDYGMGKSHLLDVVEAESIQRGFAVARITLDPRETPPSNPALLYQAILRSIRVRMPDGEFAGLSEAMQSLVNSAEHNHAKGQHYSRSYSPWLFALASEDQDLIALMDTYVRGERMDMGELKTALSRAGWRGKMPLALSTYRTYGRVYTHLIGNLSAWLRDAGYHGLLILLDEVERVDALGSEDLRWAFETLSYLSAVTMEYDDLAFEPEDLYKGGHTVHQQMPLRFREDQPLSLVFCLTDIEAVHEHFAGITQAESYDLSLTPILRGDIGTLVRRIGEIYGCAYPDWRVSGSLLESITEACTKHHDGDGRTFRACVREVIAWLDYERLEELKSLASAT